MHHLSSIADSIVIVLIAIQAVRSTILVLALPPRGREVTILALSATSYTWWVVRIIYTSHVTFHLPSPTWYACLINAFVLRGALGLLLLSRRRAVGSIGTLCMQWVLRNCRGHRDSEELSRLVDRCPLAFPRVRLQASCCGGNKRQSKLRQGSV